MLYRNANYLLSLINDILEIAKIGGSPKASNRFDHELKLKLEIKQPTGEETVDQSLEVYLAQMPSDWISSLQDAAVRGFDHDILQLTTQIPARFSPLRESLQAWVEEFQFDKVIGLVQRVQRDG
jgi:hypothetical protein